MSKDSSTLVLRNYPDDDALQHPERYSKAYSFSPDIIPLYGAEADQDTLVDPASWRGFMGMPIVGGDVNNVYIRGHGSGGPHVASLRVIPSELILWPQVWSDVQPVSSGPVVISGGDTTGRYASDSPLQFRPPHVTGNGYSLVANVFKHHPANEHKNLEEYEPTPSLDPQHKGVDGFLTFLSKDETHTFYNVVVADPTLKHVSVNTRLRMFSQSPVWVGFHLSWHEGAPIPPGLVVSLVDDHGKITIPRTPLSSLKDKELKVLLESNYDGILTLNIFSPENASFEPYSGVSLQVYKSVPLGSTLPEAAADLHCPQPLSRSTGLLGAMNIIFEPHSTRNLRFASPSATQLRESMNGTAKDVSSLGQDCGPIPVTKPAATGWWFRAQLNDTNKFPHAGPGGVSPDIQPIGTELAKAGLWNDLLDPSIDYSTANSIELVGGSDNYVFVRGHSTIAGIDVQSRLFAITGSPILHPSQHAQKGISAKVFDGSGVVDQQTISVPDANQFYMFNRPSTSNPLPTPTQAPMAAVHGKPGHTTASSQKCIRSAHAARWPNDQAENFATMADFEHWCLTCPRVCFRNISWEPCQPKEPCWDWCCSTQLVIPECSHFCSFWTIVIECDNPIIPPKSIWTLKCEDHEIFSPNGTCFENLPISTQSPALAGCHFTGARPGYSAKLVLCIKWCDDGQKIPPPRIKCRLAMTEPPTSPIKYLAADALAGSQKWPFFVTKEYPYIGGRPNPSPLPTFKSAGAGNPWSYPGAPQFVLGQVSLAANPDLK